MELALPVAERLLRARRATPLPCTSHHAPTLLLRTTWWRHCPAPHTETWLCPSAPQGDATWFDLLNMTVRRERGMAA